MAKFPLDPLFKVASREIKLAATRNFANSDYGKLIAEVRGVYRKPASEAKIVGILKKYKRLSPRRTLDQIMGSDFASVVRVVEKYAKGGRGLPQRVLARFLESLGPAGKILKSLATASTTSFSQRSSLNDAIALVRAFGGEVLMPKGAESVQDVNRGIEAAIKRLQEIGYTVTKVGEEPPARGQGPMAVRGTRLSDQRRTVDVEMASGGMQRYGKNHPIITGEMVPTPTSTNVYEFGYDYEHGYLYVRFKAPAPHAKGQGMMLPTAPGSLYRYAAVTPEEFLSLYNVRNNGGGSGGGPGDWVWDHLRERGTVSGHKKDYELVGVMNGYVPRKATVRKNQQTGALEEWFTPRLVKAHTGKWIKSRYGEELAPTSGFMVGERGAGGGPRNGRYSPRG